MPRERKQRGKRKRKTDAAAVDVRVEERAPAIDLPVERVEEDAETAAAAAQGEFFGLLDDDEQAYFKTVDETLQADEFTSADESALFVTNVLKEAEGKELRMATSPLGSKVLEALLARSTPRQVKALFKAFQGHFMHLIQQRYASHACEMLFAITSTLIDAEMTGSAADIEEEEDDDADGQQVSFENLFLFMLNEVSAHVATALANGHYAAHVLRDVLLILQGKLFTFEKAKKQAKRYHGQKKFLWSRPDREMTVPSSFKAHLRSAVTALQQLPTVQLRLLASQPASLGLVSALLGAEASLGETAVLDTLLGDLSERQDFVDTMMRESTSSQVLELAVDGMPDDRLQMFFATYLQGHLPRAARNEVTNHILQRYIARAPAASLAAVVAELEPAVKDIIEVKHLTVLQTVVEAAVRREVPESGDKIFDAVAKVVVADESAERLVPKLLAQTTTQGAYFLLACLDLPSAHSAIAASLLAATQDEYLGFATQPAALTLVAAVLKHAHTDVVARRKLLNPLAGHCADLAAHKVGSHMLDAVFEACTTRDGMKLLAQRVAAELLAATGIGAPQSLQAAAGEAGAETEKEGEKADKVDLRSDFYGRLCWRNWKMDLYQRRRGDWEKLFPAAAGARPFAAAGQAQAKQPAAPKTHVQGNGAQGKKRSIAEAALAHIQAKRGSNPAAIGQDGAAANGIHPDRAANFNSKRAKHASGGQRRR